MSKIVERISRDAGIENLAQVLAEQLSPSDLQSLLIEVYKTRAQALAPSDVFSQYQRDRFVQLSQASPADAAELDGLAYSLLPPGFEAVELSPVAPLGTCSVVSTVSQNVIVPTIRNTEVCADATNVLALECARRRKAAMQDSPRAPDRVRLCASHRLLRAQRAEGPASFQHFRLFALCTAGRDTGGFRFEVEALLEHIDFYVRLLDKVNDLGYTTGDIRVAITALDEQRLDQLHTDVIEVLAVDHPSATVGINQARERGRGYYSSACFWIHARDRSGEDYLLADGGLTDWTQRLLNNRKERLMTSGLGTERLCACFRNGEPADGRAPDTKD
jgi:hypothetical protein